MSPTISASCKIIISPRKKVLIERNGPVPDSVPSAEAKNNVRKAEHDLNVPLVLEDKIETEPSFETVFLDHDCVNLDPTFKLSPTPPPASSTATILAPLDADPLMPPYDPKTKYLFPRPQFLHYKPRPRTELCRVSYLVASLISQRILSPKKLHRRKQRRSLRMRRLWRKKAKF
ncbi:uncharacterized protein DS421_15g502550 [Arachis hypogaea]|nr:uncharacterized protein DS421_15g502550 [Arachis hypogaea]